MEGEESHKLPDRLSGAEDTAAARLVRFIRWARERDLVSGVSDFEQTCGLSPRYVHNMANSPRGSIGSDKIALVARRFPTLNVRWLCTGEGHMTGGLERDSRLARMRDSLDSLRREFEEMAADDLS